MYNIVTQQKDLQRKKEWCCSFLVTYVHFNLNENITNMLPMLPNMIPIPSQESRSLGFVFHTLFEFLSIGKPRVTPLLYLKGTDSTEAATSGISM